MLLLMVYELHGMWTGLFRDDFGGFDEDLIQREADIMKTIRDLIDIHALPCVLVGFGNSDFPAKLASLAHGLRLEQFTNRTTAAYVREFVSGMADYGVERFLSKVQPLPLSDLVPHFTDTTENKIGVLPTLHGACQQPSNNTAQVCSGPSCV